MPAIEDFLTQAEEQDIIEAIRSAEQHTSGEIRVHIERHTNLSIELRAMELFHFLKMDNTKLQNAVLIYVAIDDKNFYIYGDKGINDVVPINFWNTTKDTIQNYFIKGQFKTGLVEGVLKAGKALHKHFPKQHDDIDELPNNISKG
ncbi:MAG: TPM domain-containing protein [Flavobacteriaceae bacterium]|nr:TPM domain-containing protein [Flavobacteriaceae bacterium]